MRIQIMPLPAVLVGEDLEEPFAIVVDQCPAEAVSEFFAEQVDSFTAECGAKASLVTSETVEVVDQYADPAPPQPAPIVMDIRFPEDFDVEKATRQLRFALGLCVECAERQSRCVCPPAAPRPDSSEPDEQGQG